MSNDTVAHLKKYGFAKGAGKILSVDEMLELKQIVNELFKDESIVNRNSANAPVVVNLPGRNPRLDRLLEKVVSHEDVRSVLAQVLGDDYKIWQVNARRSEVGDKGLLLHQDAPGETNLAVLLSDNLSGAGATAFLAKSHKLPRWASRISWSRVRLAAPWLTALKGETGDYAFFFNRTWHARRENSSSQAHDIILISFFPRGAVYTPYALSEDNRKKWNGWELGRLLDPGIGTRLLENGRAQVVSRQGDRFDEPYAMSLESGKYGEGDLGVKLLYLKLLLLELVFFPLRLAYRRLRALVRPGSTAS